DLGEQVAVLETELLEDRARRDVRNRKAVSLAIDEMRQRAHLGEELRRVLHGVGDLSAAGLESSGPELLEFELAAVVLAVVVGGIVAAVAVIVVGGGGGRRAVAPLMALQ